MLQQHWLSLALVMRFFMRSFLLVEVGSVFRWCGRYFVIGQQDCSDFFNGFMVHFFGRFGWKGMMIFAAIFAVLSTAAYAVARTVFVRLFLRVALGLSFPVVQGREEQALNQVSRNLTYKDPGTAFATFVWGVAYCFIAPYRHFINRYIWIDGSPFDTYTTEPKKV